MSQKKSYLRTKEQLLNNLEICKENRELFVRFFAVEEQKLKRKNGLASLDNSCYKTLISYTQRLKNVNNWFHNKPWKDITKLDIDRIYNDLEDGKIKNRRGYRFADRTSYYNKVFKSKPFQLAGKADLAREVIEFSSNPRKEVSFVNEETFLKMVSVLSKPTHLLLFWLAWDIGENINTLLQLSKKDFIRQINEDTKETEYLVNLPREKLKRSRQSRSEPTLYPETAKYADIVLSGLKESELVFRFGYRQALKLMHNVAKKTGARCVPTNSRVSWKDLRSGMACHLLKSGWTIDEVNFRLGHKPSSKEIDAYVSYLAIDRRKPKKKLFDSNLQAIQNDLEEARKREKLYSERLRRQSEENELMKEELDKTRNDIQALKKIVAGVLAQAKAV